MCLKNLPPNGWSRCALRISQGEYGKGVAPSGGKIFEKWFSEMPCGAIFSKHCANLKMVFLIWSYSSGMYLYEILITEDMYNWTDYGQYACHNLYFLYIPWSYKLWKIVVHMKKTTSFGTVYHLENNLSFSKRQVILKSVSNRVTHFFFIPSDPIWVQTNYYLNNFISIVFLQYHA